MPSTQLVRPSRDGDQFHYLWAARRCLLLLHPGTDLVAISIEGASPAEEPEATKDDGDDVIDVAEYHVDQSLKRAEKVHYRQLKHSTRSADKAWTASGLKKTIVGFADKYKSLVNEFGEDDVGQRFDFTFVTNRPVSRDIHETLSDLALAAPARHPGEVKKIEGFTGLHGAALGAFCKTLHLQDNQPDMWEQRNILFEDLSGYLPDADVDGPTQLKELVNRKALSDAAKNPTITKIDVLRSLNTNEVSLYPAKCLITPPANFVAREQEETLTKVIVDAEGVPVIIHALGGVGKSAFSTRIERGLPKGSKAVLYDCFGNGLYRSATGYRHRHRDALVQIANELASAGLCYPLIPTAHADVSMYMKAFEHRLHQAVRILRASDPYALLCLILDAADNAQMASEEAGQARSFVRDAMRMTIPEGVRLVALCRSERRALLDAPPTAVCCELLSFSRKETADYLLRSFPAATEQDIDEFHRLTSQNPRVQALALARNVPLQQTLRLLGPTPTTVDSAIESLLMGAIADLRDSAGGAVEKERVDKICAGLAALRPLIPIGVLAVMSGVSQEAIRSFALDLGRPLLVAGDALHFRDEPVETWFQKQFKPSAAEMAEFIQKLMPLAIKSPYVAAVLPQLMLEAGMLTELVQLALNSTALPEGTPLERRDVEIQRLQFALKASLRAKRYLDAAKLSMKAGGETAGDDRQRNMIQANTDLAARFLGLEIVQELVSRRSFGSKWLGSHHVYEAGLLSGQEELKADARSRIRMAGEWLRNWSKLPAEERRKEEVSFRDMAELAMAELNVHGVAAAVRSLSGWKPPDTSFNAGLELASRLIDNGRVDEVKSIAEQARDNLALSLATVCELNTVHETPTADVTKRIISQVAGLRRKLKHHAWDGDAIALGALVDLIEAGLATKACTHEEAIELLDRHLPSDPPRSMSSRFSSYRRPHLKAYSLRAALTGTTLQLVDLAHPELIKELEGEPRHSKSQDAREFEAQIGTLLPWHVVRAAIIVGSETKESALPKLEAARKKSSTLSERSYQEQAWTADEIASVWFDCLVRLDATANDHLKELSAWIHGQKRPLFTPTLAAMARVGARHSTTIAFALELAAKAFQLTRDERADADSKSSSYMSIARAVLLASPSEARAYFNEAIAVASKIGDENLARWDALLDLAERAARADRPVPEIAYKLSRCAEVTYDYVARDKHFPWTRTVHSLAALCPKSCFTIMSRWRDRRFGRTARVLPTAVEQLIELGYLDPRDALPFVAIEAEWDLPILADSALKACKDEAEKKEIRSWLLKYITLQKHSAAVWSSIRDVLKGHKLDASALNAYETDAKTQQGYKDRVQQQGEEFHPADEDKEEKDWDAIFAGHEFTNASSLAYVYKAFRQSPPPLFADDFFAQAFSRATPGRETDLIEAVAEVPELSLYEFRSLLEQVPTGLRQRPAIRNSLAKATKVFCRRFCMGITRNRYYEPLPLKLACDLSGLDQREAVEVVLGAIGESGELPDAGRLFSLAGLLTLELTHDDALEGLIYGLDLFDATLADKDGDGAWTSKLAPPADVAAAVAGYVYAGLAQPAAKDRWMLAHVVFGFCMLKREQVVARLIDAGRVNDGGAFVGSGLPFYALHALQWLLIAFARAVLTSPHALAPHIVQLLAWASKEEDHVLIRSLAARTALGVHHGTNTLDAPTVERLEKINTSPLPAVSSKSDKREDDEEREIADSSSDDEFYFGIDFGPYWYKPLGRVFAQSQGQVEGEALRIIRTNLGYAGKGSWDEDPREIKKLYGRMQTHASHDSYPSADNQRFYLCYHSMLIAAGRLLRTLPARAGSDAPEQDKFGEWLASHDLTRRDGRWLSDRRDPQPLDRPAWYGTEPASVAWTEFSEEHFDHVFSSPRGLCVWGHWSLGDEARQETVAIRSAFVSRRTARALVRALNGSSEAHGHQIPSVSYDDEFNQEPFVMKGWISDCNQDRGIDGKDPWSGDVRFPVPAPSDEIVRGFGLKADADQREWRNSKDVAAMSSLVWGSLSAEDDERVSLDEGDKLCATEEFVRTLTSNLEKDLIVYITLERRRRFRRYETRGDDDEQRRKAKRIFLIHGDGSRSES